MNALRKLLFPLSVIYDGITLTRNLLFDNGILPSQEYDFPVVGVGNLSMGGTGKTPMVEYIISQLKDEYSLAVLSRGYGRKTSGYLKVNPDSTTQQVGDEPLQIARKYSDVNVFVDEDRRHGMENLIKEASPQVIVLDDVFQHRYVKPGFMVMLTSYEQLFYNDLVLPAGNLRESRKGAQRASCIVVTKCPSQLSEERKHEIKTRIAKYSDAPIFFSAIGYSTTFHGSDNKITAADLMNLTFTVVTGIAKPQPFVDYLFGLKLNFEHIAYGDHHDFSDSEIQKLDQLETIITTEKDYMRLRGKLKKAKVLYLPITTDFLGDEAAFNMMLSRFCEKVKR